MLDWLAIGNGWRNLFLLSCAVQALALGVFFAAHRLWFGRGRLGAFLAGASVTPLAQYLWMLALAAVWPFAPKAVYIGVLPLLAGVYLLWALLSRIRRLGALTRRALAWLLRLCRLDKPALASLCFALAMAILLAPICIRTATSADAAQADSGEYMALGLRYCEDRNLAELLEKNDLTGHFRGHAHFPSLELYMAYGMMHTGETYGYPYDKPMFTGLGLLTLYLLMAYAALLIRLTRGNRRWVLLGLLLFNLVPNLVYALSTAPRDTWRCLALLVGAVALCGLSTEGGWKRYLGKLVWIAVLCFTVMSSHVVCFVVLPFLVVGWALWQWLSSLYRRDGRAGRTLLRATGMALSGAAGTLAAYAGNLWCYFKWGTMSPWRLMTTFTSAPWYRMYMQGEYKQEVTTTHLNFWKARYDIVMAYATPIGLWGLRLALVGLVIVMVGLIVRRVRARRAIQAIMTTMPHADGPVGVLLSDDAPARAHTERMLTVLAASLITLLTLAPMSGLLDTKLYSFSGSFLTMQRYTFQWFLFAAASIAATLAALEAEWPALLAWVKRTLKQPVAACRKRMPKAGLWARRVPALLCALLCMLAFAYGTRETGYANSVYRYGRPMLTDEAMALDNSFRQRYSMLMQLAEQAPADGKILLTRPGYQYALRAKGYILTSNPIVQLMNLPLSEVPTALKAMNAVALCTEPGFWDKRYYALSTLSQYLESLPTDQIVQDNDMRIYLLDRTLIGKITPLVQAEP